MKKLLALMLTVIFVCSATLSVSAEDGNVTYSGNAGNFIFQPGSNYSVTDLFPNFKDVMPGDSISQKITVKSESTNEVKIYMRALGAHENSVDFLSQMNLRVEKLTDTKLFDAPADQKAQLTEWTLLGTMNGKGQVDLEVTLDVPVTMGNEFSEQVGYLDWEFKVEEFEDDTVKTGDNNNMILWIGCVAVAAGLVVFLIIKRRKDDEK